MISKHSLVMCLILPAALSLSPRTTAATAQASECSTQDLLGVLRADDPAHTDAMELAQALRNQGFAVKCVLQSKMVGIFEGQKGAALFRTSRGDFEALFLPKPRTFSVQPIEERSNDRYIYSFRGTPHWTGSPWDTARRIFFVHNANQFLTTWDKKLATELRKALDQPQPLTAPD